MAILLEEREERRPYGRPYQPLGEGHTIWLHCGSDRGGHAAAIHYTLMASCQRNGVEPFAYLRNLLRWLPVIEKAPDGTFPQDVLRDLLPDRWADQRP